MMIRDNAKLATIKIGSKALKRKYYRETPLLGCRVVDFGFRECPTSMCNGVLAVISFVNKCRSKAKTTGVSVEFCWCRGIEMTPNMGGR